MTDAQRLRDIASTVAQIHMPGIGADLHAIAERCAQAEAHAARIRSALTYIRDHAHGCVLAGGDDCRAAHRLLAAIVNTAESAIQATPAASAAELAALRRVAEAARAVQLPADTVWNAEQRGLHSALAALDVAKTPSGHGVECGATRGPRSAAQRYARTEAVEADLNRVNNERLAALLQRRDAEARTLRAEATNAEALALLRNHEGDDLDLRAAQAIRWLEDANGAPLLDALRLCAKVLEEWEDADAREHAEGYALAQGKRGFALAAVRKLGLP